MRRFISHVIAATCVSCLVGTAAGAEPMSATFQSKDSDKPIDVNAEDDIELQQDNNRVIARGNATAVQGDLSVHADVLTADYRAKPNGDKEVYRVFANGHVTMKSRTQTATGESAVYDFDKAALVLEGDNLTMVSDDGTVTAKKVLQYWTNEHVAVAEGSAVAIDDQQRRIAGDKLIAFFRDDTPAPTQPGAKKPKPVIDQGRNDIVYVQAFGNVRMDTATEIIRSDRGTYNVDTGIATLDGSVKMTRDKNQMNGGFAVVNVKGGTSHLYTSAAQAGMQGTKENPRVRALMAPQTKPPPVPPTTPAKPNPAKSN